MDRLFNKRCSACLFGISLLGFLWGGAAQIVAQAGEPETWTVEAGAVTGPFEAEALRLADAPGQVRRYRLSYASGDPDAPPPDDRVPAELYLPADSRHDAPVAAVVILHILNGRYEIERFIAGELARHGVAALWFKLPHYGERRTPGEGLFGRNAPDRLIDVFDRGALDVRRAFDLLASHPEIDEGRIGILGLSMGGMVAVHSAAKETRTERVALILAGGDLPRLVADSSEMRRFWRAWMALPPSRRDELLQELRRVDPLQAAGSVTDLAQDERVLMINAGADEVVPEWSTRALAQALNIEDRILWVPDVDHYTLSAAMTDVMNHILGFWGGMASSHPVVPVDPPLGLFAENLGALVRGRPGDNQVYTVEAHIDASPARSGRRSGRLSWKQGPGGRFRLDAHTEEWGRISIGQAESPWVWIEQIGMRMDGDQPVTLSGAGIPSEWDIYRRAAGELLHLVARVPGILDERLDIRTTERDDGGIRMEAKGRDIPGTLALDWDCLSAGAPRALEAYMDEGVFRVSDIVFSLEEPYRNEDFEPPKAGAAATMGTHDLIAILASFLGIPL